jgi:hypothetical protein
MDHKGRSTSKTRSSVIENVGGITADAAKTDVLDMFTVSRSTMLASMTKLDVLAIVVSRAVIRAALVTKLDDDCIEHVNGSVRVAFVTKFDVLVMLAVTICEPELAENTDVLDMLDVSASV